MISFIKSFLAIAAFLATMAGFWLGAVAIHAVWAFWLITIIALTFAIIKEVGPRAFKALGEYSVRVRNYPLLLKQVATLKLEIEDLRCSVTSLRERVKESHNAGVNEGRKGILGAILAIQVKPPTLKAVINEDGIAVLVAHYRNDPPAVGARYFVKSVAANRVKGVVEVRGARLESQEVELICVEVTEPSFWIRLAEEAILNAELPADMQLDPYTFDLRESFLNSTPTNSAESEK